MKLAAPDSGPDLSKLPFTQQQMYLAAKAGKEWMVRLNGADGRFLYGLVPSLRVTLVEDNYSHQAAAAFTVARAAKFFKEDRAATVARQALLTLLLATEKDARDPKIRYPIATGVNALEAASWLVLAINELPAPGADLLKQSEELCEFIRSQQQKDGTLGPAPSAADARKCDREAAQYAGLALYALTRSLAHRPEPWKLEVVRKARDVYLAQWRADKNMEIVPWFSAACVEAFLLTKEEPFALCANEMNDWLVLLQYKEVQPQRLLWTGGFKKWEQGKVCQELPDVHAAICMEGLAQGCRLAKERGDLQHFQTYRQALEQCGQFLLTLQYTEANSQHFETKYRQDFLLGAFHPTHLDGTLRLDYTQEAVSGLVKFLADVAEVK
jgi:hypothetical protein